MEYTNELRQRIFAAYWGCEMIENGRICQFKVGSFDLNEIKNDYYKLALTPLSKITDEDIHRAYEAAEVELYVTDFSKHHFLHSFSPNEISALKHRYGQGIYYKILDFLRSRGYDCGYGDIPSLIEAGIAIDKTTL